MKPSVTRLLLFSTLILSIAAVSVRAQTPVSSIGLENYTIPSQTVPVETPQLVEQRELFNRFVKAIQRPNQIDTETLERWLVELEGYPLYAYAQKYWLLQQLSLDSRSGILDFLAQNEGKPVAINVRKRWLQLLQDANRTSTFFKDYRPGISAELDCYYLNRRYGSTISEAQLNEKVTPLWMVSYSQPKACDPVFRRWKNAGLQTQDRLISRIVLASKEGNLRLAGFLARSLEQPYQYLGNLWRDAYRSPHRLTRMKRFPGLVNEQESAAFSFAMSRMVWSEPKCVQDALAKAKSSLKLSDAQIASITQNIALSLAVDQDPDAIAWLQRAYDLSPNDDALRWLVASSIRQGQWQQTVNIIDSAQSSLTDDIAYTYWKGRSLQALGANDLSQQSLTKAAGQRHYYGFLASAQLGVAPTLKSQPAEWSDDDTAALLQQPQIQIAYELFQQQRYSEARREWRSAMRTLSIEEKRQAALLAHEWQWFDQSIALLSQVGEKDDVARRFPLANDSNIQPLAMEYQIDPAWALAIARRESAFMVDAVSSAGARGLMQVLPSTANYLQQRNVRYSTLFEPDTNVTLGVQYLQYLMNKVNDNTLLATASYNAGWRRVLAWLPEEQPVEADIWIESIPYRETRNYVKAVLAYKFIYQMQLAQTSDVFEQLQQMKIPTKSSD